MLGTAEGVELSSGPACVAEVVALVCWQLKVVLQAINVNFDGWLVVIVEHVIVFLAGSESVGSGKAQAVIEVLLHVLI